ncbi:hypothetical protein [Celeribacter sp. PS-C1]|uniref:hypothetical protein n=1 Tax=Celeribacter sp. PS-C1 TaxID=2820813 RepID=UPI001CA4BFE0|nr:hypothetical protein [Celeribacter sp. PS-C1]MBW6418144.1 hypothetical protein [Celeribacter sp. PS-C1]
MKNLIKLVLTASAFAYAMPIVTADFGGLNGAEARSENSNGGNSGDRGNSGNRGNSGDRGNSGKDASAERGNSGKPAGKPLAASLKSLNSLGRNMNGIMNSSDPKMVPIKEYLSAVAANEEAEDAYDTANAAYADSYADLAASAAALNLSSDPADWADEIDQLSADLEANPVAEGEEGYQEYLDQVAAVEQAKAELEQALADKAVLDAAEATLAETEEAISDEALTEALVAAQNATGNGPITADDITPEMLAYARSKLDV